MLLCIVKPKIGLKYHTIEMPEEFGGGNPKRPFMGNVWSRYEAKLQLGDLFTSLLNSNLPKYHCLIRFSE